MVAILFHRDAAGQPLRIGCRCKGDGGFVEDLGAAQGILVSEVGAQKGASEFLRSPINVKALTFAELEAYVAGRFLGTCSECGSKATFPFSSREGLHLYCRDCYRKYLGFSA